LHTFFDISYNGKNRGSLYCLSMASVTSTIDSYSNTPSTLNFSTLIEPNLPKGIYFDISLIASRRDSGTSLLCSGQPVSYFNDIKYASNEIIVMEIGE